MKNYMNRFRVRKDFKYDDWYVQERVCIAPGKFQWCIIDVLKSQKDAIERRNSLTNQKVVVL